MSDIRLSDLMRTRYLSEHDRMVIAAELLKNGETAAFDIGWKRATVNARRAFRLHVTSWEFGTVADEGLETRMQEEIRSACQNQRRHRESIRTIAETQAETPAKVKAF